MFDYITLIAGTIELFTAVARTILVLWKLERPRPGTTRLESKNFQLSQRMFNQLALRLYTMCKLIVGLAPNDSHESGAFDFEEASPGIEMNKFSKLAAKTNAD